jgi:hypothetical protein
MIFLTTSLHLANKKQYILMIKPIFTKMLIHFNYIINLSDIVIA